MFTELGVVIGGPKRLWFIYLDFSVFYELLFLVILYNISSHNVYFCQEERGNSQTVARFGENCDFAHFSMEIDTNISMIVEFGMEV